MRFALCPGCSHWRAVVGHGGGARGLRTRRHGSCGVVALPAGTELRTA